MARSKHLRIYDDSNVASLVAEIGAFLLGEHATFITGTDFLADGGVIASLKSGRMGINIH